MKTRVHYPEETKWKVIEMKRMVIQICPLWRRLIGHDFVKKSTILLM
ncbi:hypothetical protein [Bacillus sp. C1]